MISFLLLTDKVYRKDHERAEFSFFSGVRGKREVYLFQVVENPMEGVKSALVIAGSDKRGTIYGLFYLSEKLGVSPLVNWNHVLPKRREYVILTEKDSAETSVSFAKISCFQ